MTALLKEVGTVTLGLEYEDVLHNRKGTATCYATHLTGCNRVCLEWVDKNGDVKEMWIDETRLMNMHGSPVVNSAKIEPGAGSDPPRRSIK